MAYTHGQRDVLLLTSGGVPRISCTGGLLLRHAPGYQPYYVRALAVQCMTTIAITIAPVVSFWESSAAGATSGSWTAIDTVAITTAGHTQGQVFYVQSLQTKIEPGHEIVAQITTVTTEAAIVQATAYIEAVTDAPGNDTLMTESA